MIWPVNQAYDDQVARGKVEGVTVVSNFGFNPDIDTAGVPEDVWTNGGIYPWMSGLTALQIRSTSPNDNPAGTGVGSVFVDLLGSLFAQTPVNAILNGVTPVAIGSHQRINQANCSSIGSLVNPLIGTSNHGDIIIEDVAAPNTVRAIIPAGRGRTRQTPYTVPLGFELLIKQVVLSIKSETGLVSQYASMTSRVKTSSGIIVQPIDFGNTSGTTLSIRLDQPTFLPAGSDWSLVVGVVSDNNEAVTAAWSGHLHRI